MLLNELWQFLEDLNPDARFCDPDPIIDCYSDCVHRLAGEGAKRILLVTHREGIRDLMKHCANRQSLKTPYCAIAKFSYVPGEPSETQWMFEGILGSGSRLSAPM